MPRGEGAKDVGSRGVVSFVSMKLALLLIVASVGSGCHDGPAAPPLPARAASTPPPFASGPPGSVAPTVSVPVAATDVAPSGRFMTDADLGSTISALSEETGEFPSDNFVSNETSLLDVAAALRRDAIRGRAYVGVGPEQNLTYARLMRASVAYVVDIRRQNMLELMVIRAAMEQAPTRTAFFSAWTSRLDVSAKLAEPSTASVGEIARAIAGTPADTARRAALRDATRSLMARLGVVSAPSDDREIAKVVDAFATQGLDIAYSMKGSGRRYPALRELLAALGPDGSTSFAANEEAYSETRRMMMENRIVPVVGDFSGAKALRGVAGDMKRRGVSLGVLYTSNVEQYLFEGRTYDRFVANVAAMPADEESLIVRVWFDQGRAHPMQRKGHRTTTLAMSLRRFLARTGTRPYRSYWEVTTDRVVLEPFGPNP